jgi:AcrR family transcriptional regulator
MSPRTYNRTLKIAAAEAARRRIVEAAAELHAAHGARGTSHAMIASRAGVSIPTVYKYFPTANDLIPACTGLVSSRLPVALDAAIFDGHPRVADRVRVLALALFRVHEYLAPWLRWTAADAEALPALRSFLESGHEHRSRLIRKALQPPGGRPPAKALVLLAETLLDSPSWKTLTSGGLTTEHAAAAVADAVLLLERSSHEHAH